MRVSLFSLLDLEIVASLLESSFPLKFLYVTDATVFQVVFISATVSKSGRFLELHP